MKRLIVLLLVLFVAGCAGTQEEAPTAPDAMQEEAAEPFTADLDESIEEFDVTEQDLSEEELDNLINDVDNLGF